MVAKTEDNCDTRESYSSDLKLIPPFSRDNKGCKHIYECDILDKGRAAGIKVFRSFDHSD